MYPEQISAHLIVVVLVGGGVLTCVEYGVQVVVLGIIDASILINAKKPSIGQCGLVDLESD